METVKNNYQSRPVVSQLQNNTTLWIGHLEADPTDYYAGQTFHCPSGGELNNIQVFSSAVHSPGEIILTLHAFDKGNKSWGPQLASASVEIEKGDQERWIRFNLPPMPIHQNEHYGFRLYTSRGMIALGEAATGMRTPFEGVEWHASSMDQSGHYYKYFSLAFKIELCA
jgi:hypothetical protein